MKNYISLLLLLLAGSQLFAQNTVRMSAVKANDYGVAYTLPKTSVMIEAQYTKTVREAGEFFQYAERYLSISNPIVASETVQTLDKIEVSTKGIIDKDKSYLVEFRSGSTAPFVTLTKDGLICAINDDYEFPKDAVSNTKKAEEKTTLPNPRSFLSEEILRAGSTSKQAELIAKQIYKLRDSRTNILTGEADNMPPDGNAYKLVISQLEEQEKALTAMFIGTEKVETGTKSFTIVPSSERNIEDRIVFRFSEKLGIVDADNLAGAPVYLSLTNREPKQEVIVTPKEEKALVEKFAKGIIYNIPSKGDLRVTFNNKSYVQKEFDIVQYGTQEVLVPKMFENNKQIVKVIFYPDLGAIKQIIQ